MPALNLEKKNLPFLLGGDGKLTVDTGELALAAPLPQGTGPIATVSFQASGGKRLELGLEQTVKLGLSAQARVQITPVFPGSSGAAKKLLAAHELASFFQSPDHRSQLVLVFEAGGQAAFSGSGSFAYGPLKATATIDAEAGGGFSYCRAFPQNQPLGPMLASFFQEMRLPEQGARAPQPGEAISLQFGGSLRLGAEVAAGYRLAGSKSVALSELVLSEKYDLSILGKVGLSAGVAGSYAILVTAADGMPGWARVRVSRRHARELKIAADVDVSFANRLDGLPDTAGEFLGAALGVNAKNFLNVFQKAQELGDFKAFREAVDGLARKFVEEYTGKAFDALAKQPEFDRFLARVRKVSTSYEKLEDRALTLFDRYFDRLPVLERFLDRIDLADKIESLKGRLEQEEWKILAQLADGDPLRFLLGQVELAGKLADSLEVLKQRAAQVRALLREAAHEEILALVSLAKRSFGVDLFFKELRNFTSKQDLQAAAQEKAGLFVSRLVGRTLDSNPNIEKAFQEVKAVLDRIDGFKDKLFKAFREAANSSYKVALHAAYRRASESDALVDVLIHVESPGGLQLLREAGCGDFERILTLQDPDQVRLHEGVFTHRTTRESAFRVNIVGWHLNYNYAGFDRVITETEQRIVPSADGLTVLTTASLQVERERRRHGEAMHVNFLLRALGESAKVEPAGRGNREFFIDTLTSLSARYELRFTDDDTMPAELEDYLAFARDLGLDRAGATMAELDPLLPRAVNGGFGQVSAAYDVRFSEQSLLSILRLQKLTAQHEAKLRSAMRRMVLANYLRDEGLHDIAFAYATPAHFARFQKEGFARFIPPSSREVGIAIEFAGIAAPAKVVMDPQEFRVLATLYNLENELVASIRELLDILSGAKKIKPGQFAKKLERFGDALKEWDRFDQASSGDAAGANTIFAMFDVLAGLGSSGGSTAGAGALVLKSKVGDREVEKVFAA
jgi:hypothetical protein